MLKFEVYLYPKSIYNFDVKEIHCNSPLHQQIYRISYQKSIIYILYSIVIILMAFTQSI